MARACVASKKMDRTWTNRSWYRPSCARRRFDRWSITATPESRLVSTVLRTRTKVRASDDLAMAKLEVYSHTSTSTASSIVRRHCNSEQLAADGYDWCQPYDEQPDSNNPSSRINRFDHLLQLTCVACTHKKEYTIGLLTISICSIYEVDSNRFCLFRSSWANMRCIVLKIQPSPSMLPCRACRVYVHGLRRSGRELFPCMMQGWIRVRGTCGLW
jgi:hypothetical protein